MDFSSFVFKNSSKVSDSRHKKNFEIMRSWLVENGKKDLVKILSLNSISSDCWKESIKKLHFAIVACYSSTFVQPFFSFSSPNWYLPFIQQSIVFQLLTECSHNNREDRIFSSLLHFTQKNMILSKLHSRFSFFHSSSLCGLIWNINFKVDVIIWLTKDRKLDENYRIAKYFSVNQQGGSLKGEIFLLNFLFS